ncbi:unnamed protein product [Effrenium voratum]|nr:unnamed protein product [Effrenium voratum]
MAKWCEKRISHPYAVCAGCRFGLRSSVRWRLPALEEQLRGTEDKLEDLGRRLQDSQGSSRLTYELRCHLESVLTRVRQRDNAIEQLLNRQERMEHAGVLQRERLAFAQEDLLSHWARKGDGKGGSTADPEPGPSEGPQEAESDVDTHAVGVQVSNEDTAELMWEAAVAVSPSACQSVGDAASLEQELQDLREEIKATKLRSAQRAEDLRAKIRQQQRRAEAEEEAGPSEADVGWLYVQKIEELEQQNRGLEEDLELLQASEQCLQADSREKEEIISSLMRAMRSDDSDRSESESAASYRRPGAGAMFFGLLRRDRRAKRKSSSRSWSTWPRKPSWTTCGCAKIFEPWPWSLARFATAPPAPKRRRKLERALSGRSVISVGSEETSPVDFLGLLVQFGTEGLSKAMRLCLGQGGWVPQMEATLGKARICGRSGGGALIGESADPVWWLFAPRADELTRRPFIYPPSLIAEHLNAQTGLPLFVPEAQA